MINMVSLIQNRQIRDSNIIKRTIDNAVKVKYDFDSKLSDGHEITNC